MGALLGGIRNNISLPCALALVLLNSCAGAGSQAGTPALPIPGGRASLPADISQALAELDAMPCPKGVSAETWAELTGALREALSARLQVTGDRLQVGAASSRSSSSGKMPPLPPGGRASLPAKHASELALRPPHGDAAASTLVYSASGALLSWGYFNPGDYDQNGVVGLSDLVPLAVHFGESTGTGSPFPENSIGAVIDGDGNGELNLADIIAIATNFGVNVEGYRVYAADNWTAAPPSPDSSNGTGTVYIGGKVFSDGAEPPGGGRKGFSCQVVPTATTQYYWVRPTDGETDGSASNYVLVVLPAKRAPIAKLSYPLTAETLAHIVWNASTSFDPDGVISRYEWDFNDDGVFEYDSGQVPTADFYYYAPGTYSCTVRVTDNDFYTATAKGTVTVTEKAKWHVNAVDELYLPSASYEISTGKLLDVQGYPGIFYNRTGYDPDTLKAQYQTVVFSRALDQNGTTWPAPTVLSTGPSSEWGAIISCAAAIVAGNPAVAFLETKYDQLGQVVEQHLKFIRAVDAAGASWPLGLSVNGGATAIAFIGGKPALLSSGTSEVYLAIADNDTGSSFNPAMTIATPTGADLSATVRDGLIEYVFRGEDIWYYRAQDLAGASWLPPVLVNPYERAASSSQLLELAGKPAVLFYDLDRRALKLRVAREADGSAWKPSVEITPLSNGNFKGWTVDERLVVFFQDRLTGETDFVWASDAEGTLWTGPMVVPGASSMPFGDPHDSLAGASIADVNGLPAVEYAVTYTGPLGENGARLLYVAYN